MCIVNFMARTAIYIVEDTHIFEFTVTNEIIKASILQIINQS
jgi:hypothetical protein